MKKIDFNATKNTTVSMYASYRLVFASCFVENCVIWKQNGMYTLSWSEGALVLLYVPLNSVMFSR